MNIIQYLTVGIHTCFRIKKPPQKNPRYPRNLRQSFNPNSFSLPRAVKLNILSSDFRSTARLAVAAERSSTVVRRASDVGCVTQQLGERTAQSNAQGGKRQNRQIANFFISFHITIYKFHQPQKHTNFQSNAQVRPN